jgi:hypothetical protein
VRSSRDRSFQVPTSCELNEGIPATVQLHYPEGPMNAVEWLLDADPAIRWQALRDRGQPSLWNTLRGMRVLAWFDDTR